MASTDSSLLPNHPERAPAGPLDWRGVRMVLALIYPGMVLVFGYVLFVGIVLLFVPTLTMTYESIRLPPSFFARCMQWLYSTVDVWGPMVPLMAIVIGLVV